MFFDINKISDMFGSSGIDMLTKYHDSSKQLYTTLEKIQAAFGKESKNSSTMWDIYSKYATGDATPNELSRANKMAQDLFKSTGFAFLISMPGVVMFLPELIKHVSKYNVVPDSLAAEFNF